MKFERLGVVVVPVGSDGESYLIPPLDENLGKEEMVLGCSVAMSPVYGGWEYPAGATEQRDGSFQVPVLVGAALREFAEETGVIISPSQLVQLPEQIAVRQLRLGKQVDFEVYIFYCVLTQLQIQWFEKVVSARKGTECLGDSISIRPRDEHILSMFVCGGQFRNKEVELV